MKNTKQGDRLDSQDRLILDYLVRGESIKRIGMVYLKLSPRTVEHYISTMRTAYNANTTLHLIWILIEQGEIKIKCSNCGAEK
jgi:DNA-binding NarL/FixJ family response regulator